MTVQIVPLFYLSVFGILVSRSSKGVPWRAGHQQRTSLLTQRVVVGRACVQTVFAVAGNFALPGEIASLFALHVCAGVSI